MTEKPEIVEGLRNAVARGFTLEAAVQSFMNAGYNPQDVEDSVKVVKSGVLHSIHQQQVNQPIESQKEQIAQDKIQTSPIAQELPQQAQAQQPMQAQAQQSQQQQIPKQIEQIDGQEKEKNGVSMKMTIILLVILILLIGVLVLTFIFKNSIIEFLGGLIG